jgi:hypothetical protein
MGVVGWYGEAARGELTGDSLLSESASSAGSILRVPGGTLDAVSVSAAMLRVLSKAILKPASASATALPAAACFVAVCLSL